MNRGGDPPATRYQALDSWRGVAAVLVVVYHSAFAGPLSVQGLGRAGYLWVDFFFVLSGFVIAHAYVERIASGRDAAVFLVRRFGRLWPLHLVMLLAYLIAEGAAHVARAHAGADAAFAASANDNTPMTFLANLFLFNAMGVANSISWNGLSWSIGAEFWTYWVFAAAVLMFRGPARLNAFVCLAAAAGLTLAWVSPHAPLMDATYDFGFLRALYGFFIGASLHAVAAPTTGALSRRAATALEVLAAAGAVAFLWLCGAGPLSWAAPFAFAPLVLVFAHQRGALSSLLQARPFVKLGAWSYSIYMISGFIGNAWTRAVKALVAKTSLPPLQMSGLLLTSDSPLATLALQLSEVVLLVLIVAIAAVSFETIEKPARSAFNALAERLAWLARRADARRPRSV